MRKKINKTNTILTIITIILSVIAFILSYKLAETQIPKELEFITTERTNTEKELLGTYNNKKVYYTDNIQVSVKYKNKTYTMQEILKNKRITMLDIYRSTISVTPYYCEDNLDYYYKDFWIVMCNSKNEIHIVKDRYKANCSCN